MASGTEPTSRSAFAGEVVVFTGRLSTIGRKDAQALVVEQGGDASEEVSLRTTLVVLGEEGYLQEIDKSNKLKKAQEINRRQPGRIRIIPEREFCHRAGLPTPDELKQQYYALREIRGMYPAIRDDHVRYLEKWGVIKPAARTHADRFFSFADLLVLRQAAQELADGVPFRTLLRTLAAAREGQLAFEFRLDASPARILALEPRREAPPPAPGAAMPPARLAEHWFLKASMLDGHPDTQEEAADAYRQALAAAPDLVPALINLANIYYERDQMSAAQQLYERAIGIEGDYFEAYFNLGNIHHDRGEYPEARRMYAAALRLNPEYADTHFYLAVTLEKMGLAADAKPHWRAYQHLAPNGEWVELAKEFGK